MNVVAVVILVLITVSLALGVWTFYSSLVPQTQEKVASIMVLDAWGTTEKICATLRSVDSDANVGPFSLLIGERIYEENVWCDFSQKPVCTVCFHVDLTPGVYEARIYSPKTTEYVFKVRVLEPKPQYNLYLSALGYPPQWDVNIEFNVSVTVCNESNASLPVGVELRDTTEGNTYEKDVNVDANACTSVLFSWKPMIPGEHTLTAIVDPDNVIPETVETDNTLSANVLVFQTYAHIMRGGAFRLGTVVASAGSVLWSELITSSGSKIYNWVLSSAGHAEHVQPILSYGGGWDCNDDTNCYLPS